MKTSASRSIEHHFRPCCRYHFNGKETDEETGLQDYGFRIYDQRIARFLSIDPLASDYPWYSTYQFAGNKPIKYIDLDGAEETIPSTTVVNPQVSTSTTTSSSVELAPVTIIGRMPLWRRILWPLSLVDMAKSFEKAAVEKIQARKEKEASGEIREEVYYDGIFGYFRLSRSVDVGKVGTVPDLDGLTLEEADAKLKEAGFEGGEPTDPGNGEPDQNGDSKNNKGGYRTYKHPDGSKVTIKPDGTVVRSTKPRYDPITGAIKNKGEKLIKTKDGFNATRDQKIIHENRDIFQEKIIIPKDPVPNVTPPPVNPK